jgi:hypothetical protein
LLRLLIPKGPDRPYCVDEYKYYVRDEAETTLAVRDELVALVREALQGQQPEVGAQQNRDGRNGRNARGDSSRSNRRGRGGRASDQSSYSAAVAPNGNANKPVVLLNRPVEQPLETSPVEEGEMPGIMPPTINEVGAEDAFYLPQIGVEIVATEVRNGNRFHSIRDLRNGHVIHNVTRKGARKLWSYAIQQHEDNAVASSKIQWQDDIGLVHTERRAGKVRHDLALRGEDGTVRIFYGVTEDGMEGRWATFVQEE